MKRISMSTTYTQQQIKIASDIGKQNEVKIRMTKAKVEETQERNDKNSLNGSNCQLFGFNKVATCFCSEKKDVRLNSVNYHKLRHKRVSSRQMSSNKKQAQTESIKQFFTDTKSILPINPYNEHYTMSSLSFITFSPYEARINSSNHHAKPSAITTTTVPSLLIIPQTRLPHLQQKGNHLTPSIINQKIPTPKVNSPRFSTLDSCRVKQNLQETINPNQLFLVSKLSESIELKEEGESNEQIQQRNMRNKQFIKSLKDSSTNSPIKYFKSVQYGNKNIKVSQVSADSNEQELSVHSIKTIRPENLPCSNRYKKLADCGNTIVSLYIKSSQKRSRLQESSVVFQASKQVEEQCFEIAKSRAAHDAIIVSDGEIAVKKCENKQKNVQNYQSFSEKYHYNLSNQTASVESAQVPINKNYNKFNGKTFLRTQRKQSPLERTSHDESVQFDEIKFDANTFTEYGPL